MDLDGAEGDIMMGMASRCCVGVVGVGFPPFDQDGRAGRWIGLVCMDAARMGLIDTLCCWNHARWAGVVWLLAD